MYHVCHEPCVTSSSQEPGHGDELPLRCDAAGALAAGEGGQLGAFRGRLGLAAGARRPHPGTEGHAWWESMDIYYIALFDAFL